MPPPPGPPLQKFILHSPALTAPTSPLVIAGSGPSIPLPLLASIRATLDAEKAAAAGRLVTRDGNRRILTDRAANDKKMADDKAREKEVERKRKREEDDRRERERVERVEREREDRERGERDEKKRIEDEYELAKAKEEEEKRVADQRERETAIRRARELKEREVRDANEAREAKEAKDRDKAKVVQVQQVLQIVRENEADRENEAERAQQKEAAAIEASNVPPPPSLAAPLPLPIDNDVVMAEPPPLPAPLTLPVSPPSPLVSAPTTLPPPSPTAVIAELPPVDIQAVSVPLDRVPSIRIVSSPEPDDDPLPPLRHKSSDKKKRKRDQILDSDASDSDDPTAQPLLQKIRKLGDQTTPASVPAPASPASSSSLSILAPLFDPTPTTVVEPPPSPPRDPYEGLTPLQRKLKEEKFIKHSIPTRPPANGTAQAFYLPTHSLVPPKPISVPPIPTPKKQSEVSEDFSKAKPGTQITHNTFHTWAEAYLRPFGEDDLAFLAPKPEDDRAYETPELGKYYTDRWDDEDAEAPVASTSYVSPLEPPVLPRLRPEALTEDALGMENVFLGPLSERLVAALAFEEPGEMSDMRDKVERDDEGAPPTKLTVMDAVDLEERIKKELRFIGLLEEEDVDWGTRADDEVSSALRACQRLLQRQTALNEARKSVLSSIVKDRMAYQDYEATRDAQERVIENGWTKRQRAGKKKGKGKERDRPTEGPKPPVSLALLSAVEKRRKLVSHLKPFFEEEEDAGRFYGIPERSVYAGLGIEESRVE